METIFFNYSNMLKMSLRLNNLLQYNTLEDNETKLKFLFAHIDINKLPRIMSKDIKAATLSKQMGDEKFLKGMNSEAIETYNLAMQECPQNSLKSKELYATLVEQRCAVFCANKEYNKALKDLEFIEDFGHCLNIEEIISQKQKVQQALRNIHSKNASNCKLFVWTSNNRKYPALSEKVTIQKNDKLGRYLVATCDIKPGEAIGAEKPYVANFWQKNACSNCYMGTNKLYCCPECFEQYCSLSCMEKAKVYHKYECNIYFPLDLASFPVRMITRRSLQQVIEDEKLASTERLVDVYTTGDYYNISRLMVHEPKDDNLKFYDQVKVIMWLKLLRMNSYFGAQAGKSYLSTEELYIGKILLKYIQIAKFNAHSLSDFGVLGGTGLFPTLALVNHSCNPSAMVNVHKDMLLLHAIKPIKSGEEINTSYCTAGYHTSSKQKRQKEIAVYQFNCTCKACIYDWPQNCNINYNIWKYLCDCGQITSVNITDKNFANTCPACKQSFLLHGLCVMDSVAKFTVAKSIMTNGNAGKARELMIKVIDVLSQIIAEPTAVLADMHLELMACLSHELRYTAEDN